MQPNRARDSERRGDGAAETRKDYEGTHAWPSEVVLYSEWRSPRSRMATGHAHGSTLFEPIATRATRTAGR